MSVFLPGECDYDRGDLVALPSHPWLEEMEWLSDHLIRLHPILLADLEVPAVLEVPVVPEVLASLV